MKQRADGSRLSPLQDLFDAFRATARTEREKDTYLERLIKAYLQDEPYYQDLYAGRISLPYPLELFLCVITVSLETMKIVRTLPALDIRIDG